MTTTYSSEASKVRSVWVIGFVATVLVTVLSLSGCSGGSTTGLSSALSNPASTSSTALNASTTSVSFGNVIVGEESTAPVTFENSGASNISITGVVISAPDVKTDGLSVGLIIAPGETVTLHVTFTPAEAGVVTGSVTVTSNASNSPVSISLSGTGQAVSTSSAGWTYLQSSVSTGCQVSRSCTIALGNMLPTTAGTIWAIVIKTGNSVTISSVSGGGGSWIHCPTCHVSGSSISPINSINLDASYNLTGNANTGSITVTLSSSASGFFQIMFYELLPPPGSAASLDTVGTASQTGCATCTAVGLGLSATDAVIQIQAGGSVAGWNAWSSPYLTDTRGNGVALNVTSGPAPTVAMTASTNVIFLALAFKSTAGLFSPPTPQFSLVHFTSGGNCSGATCSLSIPATGSGHLLYLEAGDIVDSHITAVSGGGTWVVPSACVSTVPSTMAMAMDIISCAYVLSSTAGATSLDISISGNASLALFEVATSSGSFALDTLASSTAPYTQPVSAGQALTLTGANDVIFQSIFLPGGVSAVTLYPQPYINGAGDQFFLNQAASVVLLNTTDGSAPMWPNQQSNPVAVSGVAFTAR